MNDIKRLSRIGLITSLGDNVSLFAMLQLIENLGYGPLYASFCVVVESISVIARGMVTPWICRHINTRPALFWSQIISGITLTCVLMFHSLGFNKLPLLFMILFIQALMKLIFDTSRDTHCGFLRSVGVFF